jgi:hypothetical protein
MVFVVAGLGTSPGARLGLFVVHQKGELACRDLPVPGQQLMLIHVSRKPVDCVNRAASPERIAKGRTKP